MPALPLAPAALKCKYVGTYAGMPWVNIFYLKYAGSTPVDADLITIAGNLRTYWNANWGNSLCAGVSLQIVEVLDISRNPGAIGTNNAGATGSGGATGLPANVAVCISKRIPRRYRGGHPRNYLPGIPTTATTDMRNQTVAYNSGLIGGLAAWYTSVNAMTTASTGAVKLANVSYWTTPVRGQPPVLKNPPDVDLVSAITVNLRLDTQRRRLG